MLHLRLSYLRYWSGTPRGWGLKRQTWGGHNGAWDVHLLPYIPLLLVTMYTWLSNGISGINVPSDPEHQERVCSESV